MFRLPLPVLPEYYECRLAWVAGHGHSGQPHQRFIGRVPAQIPGSAVGVDQPVHRLRNTLDQLAEH